MFNVTTGQFSAARKMRSNEFSETTAVVVSDGFCIAESFQYGISLHDLFFQSALKFKFKLKV